MEFLLHLPDYYTLNALIKSSNNFVLKNKFSLLISRQNFNTINDIIYVNSDKVLPYFIFEHYFYKDLCFLKLSLYEYYKVISVVKREQKQEKDYKFDNTHTQKKCFYNNILIKRHSQQLLHLKRIYPTMKKLRM